VDDDTLVGLYIVHTNYPSKMVGGGDISAYCNHTLVIEVNANYFPWHCLQSLAIVAIRKKLYVLL
jgi:hypothetical protein